MKWSQGLGCRITQTEGDLVIDVVRVLVARLMQTSVALRFLLRETLHGSSKFAPRQQ